MESLDARHAVHSASALLVAMLALMTGVCYEQTPQTQVTVLTGTTVFFGLPHGALDFVVAEWSWRQADKGGRGGKGHTTSFPVGKFIARYALGMGATLAVWRLCPELWLLAFLLASMAHFGEADAFAATPTGLGPIAEAAARGGLLLLPIRWHAREVGDIFAALMGGGSAARVTTFCGALSLLHAPVYGAVLLGHAWALVRGSSRGVGHALTVAEMLLLPLLFHRLPPLVAFLVYFNFFHSARHLLRLAHEAGSRPGAQHGLWRHKGKVAGLAVVCAVLLALAAATWDRWTKAPAPAPASGGDSDSDSDELAWAGMVLRVVFVGLSCLTTPHMLLIYATLAPRPRLDTGGVKSD